MTCQVCNRERRPPAKTLVSTGCTSCDAAMVAEVVAQAWEAKEDSELAAYAALEASGWGPR